ncbi:acyl-CoA synthetase (AMP-forming)/AMP-acid ligase II [Bradyrhizobium sp. USDA 4369]
MSEFLHSRCFRAQHMGAVALHLLEPELRVTYDELAVLVVEMTDLLKSCGIGPGSRLAVVATHSLEFASTLLSASRLGAAVAPIDASLRGLSLADHLVAVNADAIAGPVAVLARTSRELSRVRIAFDDRDHAKRPRLSGVVTVNGEASPFQLMATNKDGPRDAADTREDCRPTDDLLLIATSGSTGKPKIVRLSHAAVIFNAVEHLHSLGLSGPFQALQSLGLSYSYGLISSFLSPLVVGGTVVLPPRGDITGLSQAIETGRPTVALMTPALIEHLVNTGSPTQLAVLGEIQRLGIGGDACPEWLRRTIAETFPSTAIYVTYGATEAGPRIATLPPADFLAHPLSVGLPLNGVQVKVVDEAGAPVRSGMSGRLLVSTPSRMSGYLGHAEPTSQWLEIGDIAAVDAQGYLSIQGRADRAFKYRGRMFHPAQVECVIKRFPSVLFSHVEPMVGSDGLQATVHYRSGTDSAHLKTQLLQHCRRNLPGRLVPSHFITIAEDHFSFFKGRRLRFGSESGGDQAEASQQGRA